ncbi:hypothetical protein [Ramlibacter sp.]|uniref:hypothetical protein n=1 Tax=Ramlibacter sp. TaxID=1917967 RepID=UPI003D0DE2FB
MLQKTMLAATLAAAFLAVAPAHAQTASSPAKKELIARILKLQQPGIEQMARSLAEEPAEELMARAAAALPQRVAPEKQEAVAKEIQNDLKKYADEAVPIARAQALKIAPTTVGKLLDEKFTEAELRQIAQIIENPVYVKFQTLGPEMQKTLADTLVNDTKAQISPKVRALEMTIARRLGVQPQGGSPAAPASR